MFERLQNKWGVGPGRMVLILCTFALGGSACAWIARQIIPELGLESRGWRIAVEVVLVTLLWPLTVLLISIFTGQFRFFTNYLRRMGARMGIGKRSLAAKDDRAARSAKDGRENV